MSDHFGTLFVRCGGGGGKGLYSLPLSVTPAGWERISTLPLMPSGNKKVTHT